MQIFEEGDEGKEKKPQFEPRSLGVDPKSGFEIMVKLGPYGPYLELIGSEVAAEKKAEEKKPEEVKPDSVDLEKSGAISDADKNENVKKADAVAEEKVEVVPSDEKQKTNR